MKCPELKFHFLGLDFRIKYTIVNSTISHADEDMYAIVGYCC